MAASSNTRGRGPEGVAQLRADVAAKVDAGALELPMLPEAANRVLSLCSDPSIDAAELADAIHEDQALAAHILRVANSPAYLPTEPIRSLRQAVSRLGLNTLRDITIAVAVQGQLFVGKHHRELVGRLWRHSLGTAYFAREVSRVLRRHAEGAFLWGLMHDVGRAVVLNAVYGADEKIAASLDPDSLRYLMDELHCPAGAALAEQWQLPAAVVAAIRHHHAPELADEDGSERWAAWLVQLADVLAHGLEGDAPAVDASSLADHDAVDPLNLYPEQIETLLEATERIREQVVSIA